MSKLFSKCINELDESIDLIDDVIQSVSISPKKDLILSTSSDGFDYNVAESLIDKCNVICEHYSQDKKPVIRIIHHFACSGGTLISKCISSMPNVYLLSEVHPYSELHLGASKAKYMPTDITSLAKYAGVPKQKKLAAKIFLESIKSTDRHVRERGGTLILRDHTHSDFCVDTQKKDICEVVNTLSGSFESLSIITLRDPIDSYSSLVTNGWAHLNPATFDEYCKRLLQFVKAYPDTLIVLYENFVLEPKLVMKMICKKFEIKYDDTFEYIFDGFNVTGDSGRSGSVISSRKRKEFPKEYVDEIKESTEYKLLVTYLEKKLNLPLQRKNYVLVK